LPLDGNFPRRRFDQPHDCIDQLELPVAFHAGYANDLAGAHFQIHAPQPRWAAAILHGQVFRAEDHLTGRLRSAPGGKQHLAPDHQLRQLGAAGLGCLDRGDQFPFAQHADSLAQLEHLIQAV